MHHTWRSDGPPGVASINDLLYTPEPSPNAQLANSSSRVKVLSQLKGFSTALSPLLNGADN